MKYLEAKFTINCDEGIMQIAKDLLADIAGSAGFESFEETETGMNGYVQEQLLNREMLDTAIQEFPIDTVEITYNINKVEDRDWNEVWEREGFAPINIEDRIVVYDAKTEPPAVTAAPVQTAPIMIGIDARQAFGTGTHETTQMIIATLLAMDVKGKSTLDCGCGTGILSIAAAKLGATRCAGYDIDEWSVNNAKHNATLNNAAIDAWLGDATVIEKTDEKFDVVMANINRNILLADMPSFARVMNGGGTLILSGFYPADIDQLCDKAAELGLKETERKTNGDWACLIFDR